MRTQGLCWLAAGGLLSLFFFPSCTSGQTPASKTAKPAAQSPQWITHKDPQYYSVESPPGWTASPDRQKGWVHLIGTQGEDVLIWPVFIPGSVDTRFAPLIHRRLAAASPYNAQWETPQPVAPNALRARGASANTVATSVFTWVSSPKGLAGFFYVVAAREPDYRQKQNDFARILQSFRIIGAEAPSAAAAGAVQYVRFSDPKEGAFTLDVPAGWKTDGGLFRFNALDYRLAVETVSPDGQMRIMVGDAAIPPFTDPTGNAYLSRFPEGSVYAPYGFASQVRRFTPGAVFCRDYVLSRVSQLCPNPQITEVKDRSDLIPQAVAASPDLAQMPRVSIGEASFRCGGEAQIKGGFCQALTSGSLISWKVRGIEGYLASPEQAVTADSIMTHMGKSLQFSPQWTMMQLRNEGATSQIVSETANRIADMAANSQRARDAVDDEIARRRSNATLGIVDLADPETGRRISVESGSNYYWVDPRGVIVGTNTDALPNVDFRALVQLP